MINIYSLVLFFLVSSLACAGDAIEWLTEDGGNGHWYQRVTVDISSNIDGFLGYADTIGAYPASITSVEEDRFILDNIGSGFIGLYAEPNTGSFTWTTGEALSFVNWGPASCPSGPYPNNPDDDDRVVAQLSSGGCMGIGGHSPAWDDFESNTLLTRKIGLIVEWSGDCTEDGIVDYGQILDGTYADENKNGIPDCCDMDISCPGCPADFDEDGMVGGPDLGLLLGYWRNSDAFPSGDLNFDGDIDAADLGLLLGYWGFCQ